MQAQVMNNANRIAANVAGQGQANSRLDRWLGEAAPGGPKLITLTEEMLRKLTVEQMLEITRNNLPILGKQAHSLFVPKLPEGHKLMTPKEFRPLPSRQAPYLGACKIGQVVVGRDGDRFHVNEVFMSTFDADIDLSGKNGDLYVLKDKNVSTEARMFYGINTIWNSKGDMLGFDMQRGDKGVAFQTNNQREALFEIAAASTGVTVEELKQRLAAKGPRP